MPRACLVQSSAESVTTNMPSIHREPATSQNFSYQRDIRYIFKINKWILGTLGIWPIALRGIGRYVSKIAIMIWNLSLGFAIVPSALLLIYEEKDVITRLKIGGLLAFCIITMMKYCILVVRRPKILHCIEYVKKDWWQVTYKSDRELMLKYANNGRNLTIIFACIMYTSGCTFHLILPFFTDRIINNRTVRPLVYPTNSGFRQSQISPVYEMVYLTHSMCGYTIMTVTVGAYGLVAMFATHMCGQIQVIISRLEDLLDGERFEENQNVHQRIAAIVKRHIRVLRFAAIMEEILQEVCLVEFANSVCTICLLEYYCIVDWQANDRVSLTTYFLLLTAFFLNIYTLCYTGELVMEKSSEIGSKCYMINWYQLSPTSARNLILIIAMSSNPIKITGGGIVDLSLLSFGNIMKTSMVYLNFLRTLVV